MRIQLKAGLQLLQRGPTTVQIGLDGRHGSVLEGLDEPDLSLLHDLAVGGLDDGLIRNRLPSDPPGRERARRARVLIEALAGTGALLHERSGRAALSRLGELRARLAPDAAAWSLIHPRAGDGWQLLADRGRGTVEIHGSGRIGAALAALLAAAGVGRVDVVDPRPTTPVDLAPGGALPDDVGRSRTDAARRAVERALGRPSSERATAPVGGAGEPTPDLVVLVDRGAADATRADRLVGEDVAHLSVVVRETSVIVGPLVVPGRSPCLRCLDLHRSEHDPQWPLVLAQLLSRRGERAAPHEETALGQLAAALAALQVIGHLDGQTVPSAVGATLEAELPDGLISRRPWSGHPRCGCFWPPSPDDARADPAVPGRRERTRRAPETMRS